MYTEIVVSADRAQAEALSDALLECGALSATLEDADAGSPDEEALFGEPHPSGRVDVPAARAWRHSRIVALFDSQADIADVLAQAAQMAGMATPEIDETRQVADADWVRLTQAQFDPIPIGARLWIVPSWHELPEGADPATCVRLDPGLAFGTGSHPTTRLCLSWLDEHVKPGIAMIDYGCGSGILAIAAKKLGAGRVVGTDIDPQALIASRDNARENDCEVTFLAVENMSPEPVELVVANILSNPLKILAPHLSSLVAPGGTLVLSGVLERQIDEVSRAYASHIRLSTWRVDEGWACLVGQRAQTSAP